MNNLKLNYWINLGLIISFFTCFFTGLIKWPGIIKIIGISTYKVLSFRNISLWHDWSGLIMGLLVLIHLVLNWNWMVAVTKKFFRKT
ncbi:DUF4405 domain-containing protein [Candidatus Pacearchaeota archaeon]|nr:DUF4405 domain-containing protein [Candidatus Pacearchaeota archaeon]